MTNESTAEIFRGHLEECLKHLLIALEAAMPRGTKGASKARQPIADFCGVGFQTITRWLYHGESPVGEPLIKLMCYLDMIGYRVIELERMPTNLRNLAELIGYGIIKPDEAAQLIGYKNTFSIYQVLRGNCGFRSDKELILWNTWKERREALGRKKEEARSKLKIGAAPAAPTKTAEPTPLATEENPQPDTSIKRIEAIFQLIHGLTFLLQEEFKTAKALKNNPQDLERTTQLAHDASARFNALGSDLPPVIPKKEDNGG